MFVRIANSEDPYQTASSEGLFGSQEVFEILEDLPYLSTHCDQVTVAYSSCFSDFDMNLTLPRQV